MLSFSLEGYAIFTPLEGKLHEASHAKLYEVFKADHMDDIFSKILTEGEEEKGGEEKGYGKAFVKERVECSQISQTSRKRCTVLCVRNV